MGELAGSTIANALCPVFFVLLLGFFAGYRKLVDNKNVSQLNRTLMDFALPCSLFVAIARTSRVILIEQSRLVLALGLAMVLIYALTWVMQRKLFHADRNAAAIQSLTVSFANNVAVGLPLFASVFGPEGTVAVAAAIAVGAILIAPVTLVILEAGTKRASAMPASRRLVYAIVRSFKRPVVLAPLLGMAVSLAGFHLPALAGRLFTLLGDSTAGLALFLTGLILSAQPFRLSAGAAAGVLLKNIGHIAIMLALLRVIHLPASSARQAILLAALPAGFFGTVFGATFGVASIEASSTLIASTAFSAVTLAIAIVATAAMR
jgi:malonate transporter and related proteins